MYYFQQAGSLHREFFSDPGEFCLAEGGVDMPGTPYHKQG